MIYKLGKKQSVKFKFKLIFFEILIYYFEKNIKVNLKNK